ncbi:hypothetical protein Ancab_015488, partial [Ancistrocladus abbreviatus]
SKVPIVLSCPCQFIEATLVQGREHTSNVVQAPLRDPTPKFLPIPISIIVHKVSNSSKAFISSQTNRCMVGQGTQVRTPNIMPKLGFVAIPNAPN